MLIRLPFLPLVALLIAISIPGAARADSAGFVPDQVIVELLPGADLNLFNARYGSSTLDSVAGRPIHLLAVPPHLDAPAFLDLIAGDADLVFAELDFIPEDVDPQPGTQSIFLPRSARAFVAQHAFATIDSAGAQAASDGAGVTVAVIDSGVDATHPLLAGAVRPDGVSFLPNDPSTLDVADGLDNDDDGLTDEATGHGTIIAGVIRSLAPQARILPFRVMDSDGGCTTFRLVAAVYAASDAGAQVINISIGTVADPQSLRDAVAHAVERGAVVVASAGNDDTSDPVQSPSSLVAEGAIGVAATDRFDLRTPFTNYGVHILLSAPGDAIVGPIPGGGYGLARGTSFAAPLVSATAALICSVAPLAHPDAVVQRLAATSVPIDTLNPGFEGLLGAGRLSAAAALGTPGDPLPGLADFNADKRVNAEDLYLWHLSPRDLNLDGAADAADAAALSRLLQSQ